MLSDDQILELIKEKLSSGLDDLWDVLTPDERMQAFSRLIVEYVECTY